MMMAIMINILFIFASLLVYGCNTNPIPSSILSERLNCPKDCNCYFFEMNWTTECLNKNLTSTSYIKLDQVTVLNMSGNHLKEIKSFPANIKIKVLYLSENLLTKIQNTTFAGLKQLTDIDLSSNLIFYIDPEAFVDNTELITLRLNGNPLNHVDGSFLSSKSLLNLYLANCNLTALSTRFFSKTNGLNRIDLSENPINIIEPGVFNSLASLKHLILSKCNLSYVPADTFMTVRPTWVRYESGGNCDHGDNVERTTRIIVIRDVGTRNVSKEKYLTGEKVYMIPSPQFFALFALIANTINGFLL